MGWRCRVLTVVVSILWLAPLAWHADAAPSDADYYKGKTINLMVGYSAGGTDDMWARLIARYLGSHIAGNPTVITSNVPGAGSLTLTNKVYNTLPQDGTVIALINRSLPFANVLGGPGIQFDAKKMHWIGSPDTDTNVCVARKDASVQTITDMNTKELIVGVTGVGTGSAVNSQVLSELFGLKFKQVAGYPGSTDIALAVDRGEIEGQCLVYDTLVRQDAFKAGRINILVQLALQPDERMPNVPLAISLAKNEIDKDAFELFIMRNAVGRPLVIGPDVPPQIVSVLRDAFAATMKDPAFLEEAKRSGLNPRFISAQKIDDYIAAAYAMPPAAIERLKGALHQSK